MIWRCIQNGLLSFFLGTAVLMNGLGQETTDQKHPVVGAWELTSDWGKGEEGKGKHLLVIKPDLTGTIKDLIKGETATLKELKTKGDSLSFSYVHGEKEGFEIAFSGSLDEKAIKGTFSIFGAKATVVGSPITDAKAQSITSQGSLFDQYEARRFTSANGETLQYRLFIPKDYDPKGKYPLVLFHHGGGGAGDDNRQQLEGACVREWILPQFQAEHPCFIVAPQIPGKSKIRPDKEAAAKTMQRRIQAIHEILDQLEEEFPIDQAREVVTGLSFGGECTWLSLIERPERFAAAVPICAGDRLMNLTTAERGQQFAQFPLWIVHGDADKIIPVDVSRKVVQALKDAGGNPKYTEYPGVGHNSWDRAYRDPKLITWLFAQSRETSVLPVEQVNLRMETLTAIRGTEQWDWWQARTAQIPGEHPLWVTTMSETGKKVSHDFHDIYQTVSRDEGKSWSEPTIIPSLKRAVQDDGFEVAIGDLWPTWQAKSGTVLTTGKSFNFEGGKREIFTREKVSYAVMNAESGEWGPMRFLSMPEKDHSGMPIVAANAGNNQRVDLPDGDILLPVRYQRGAERRNYTSVVVRCGFDGKTLTYKQHGSELNIPQDRGLYEPSLTEFQGRYYFTLRADHSAFVTKGTDGINFEPIREWKFDDGTPLGSYNTQQHWITAGDGLFLVYTRKGADNDHVFRHRAPLFIGQVHPETLRVIRATERILIPEDQATLGNSGVCRLNDRETLVTCGEGLMRLGKRKDELNKVHFVKVIAER